MLEHFHDGIKVVGKRTHVQAGENIHGNATLEEFAVSKPCSRPDCPECYKAASVGTIRDIEAMKREVDELEKLTDVTEPIRKAKLILSEIEREGT